MKRQTRQKLLIARGAVEAIAFVFVSRWLIDLFTDRFPGLHDRIWTFLPQVAGFLSSWLFARRILQAKDVPPDSEP
jgi:hypothetical protein